MEIVTHDSGTFSLYKCNDQYLLKQNAIPLITLFLQ